jgi:mannose-6-phosphate isomerase-like protein (cupin superfamily)
MTAATRAYLVRPGEGEQLHALGLTAIEKIRSADTNGVCYAFEVIAPPGFGIPPHVHHLEDEVLYVIEGEYAIVLGEERLRAGPGSVLNFTRGTAHGFESVGPSAGRVLHVVTPGSSFEQFLHELVQLPPGPPDIPALAALFGKYGMELLPPPER